MSNNNYNYYVPWLWNYGYPVYCHDDVLDIYHYGFGYTMDSPNFISAGGTSWSNGNGFARNTSWFDGNGFPRNTWSHGNGFVGGNTSWYNGNGYAENTSCSNDNGFAHNTARCNGDDIACNTSWSGGGNGFDCNQSGRTGVFIPNLEHGARTSDPSLDLLENPNNKVDQESRPISIDAIPDELQEMVLKFLPLTWILRASSVCKKWKQIVHSGKFDIDRDSIFSKKPWYFMFTNSDKATGFIYDPVQGHWYDFKLPLPIKDTWSTASSSGMICTMHDDDCNYNYKIDVCNPMTRKCRKIEELPGARESTYSSLAFSVDQSSHTYTIAIVRSWEVPDSFSYWHTSVHIYSSKMMTWLPPFAQTLHGWRARNDSIILDRVLYLAVTEVGMANSHALLTYNLDSPPSNGSLIKNLIRIPYPLTCVRLINLQNELVMVGGLGAHDVPNEIGIWMLRGSKWDEISKVPAKFFPRLGEVDDVFACSGTGGLIYIHAYGETSVLVFDMNSRVWRWCRRSPLTRKYDIQVFCGFCFEPRLDIAP